jgi:hypothetical protein
LIGTHILKLAVGVFTVDGKYFSARLSSVLTSSWIMQARTAAATWNVIQHFSAMSEETIQNMEGLVDDLSDDMMLGRNICDNFDKLKYTWSRRR